MEQEASDTLWRGVKIAASVVVLLVLLGVLTVSFGNVVVPAIVLVVSVGLWLARGRLTRSIRSAAASSDE